MTTYLASSTRDLGTKLRDNMKTQLKWRHRNIPYICTYFTPGFLAPSGTISQHTVHDALRFFTSIALITCCAILISALYFTLPLSLAASHRTLHESSRTTIKLQIFCLVLSSLSFLLHSVQDYVLRSVFLVYYLVYCCEERKRLQMKRVPPPRDWFLKDTNMAANMADGRSCGKALFLFRRAQNCHKKKPRVLSCVFGERQRKFYLFLAFVFK